MNFPRWLEGILVAAVAAGVPAIAAAITDSQHADFRHLGAIGVTAAIIGVAAWLRQAPPPPPAPPSNMSSFPQTK
jgi:hypothetical protein